MKKTIENPIASVFKYLSISILFMFIGFVFGKMFVPITLVRIAHVMFFFIMFGLLIMQFCSKKGYFPRRFSMNLVYLFTFVDGILMYPLLQYYLQSIGSTVFISVIITSILLFSGLAYIANKKEAGYYLGIGKSLNIVLLGIIVVSLVNFLIGSERISFILSIGGVTVFSLYILYDVSLLKHEIENKNIVDKDDLSMYVFSFYIDFIYILLDLLHLVTSLKD